MITRREALLLAALLRLDVVVGAVLTVAVLIAAGFWVNAMISPVTRQGRPTRAASPILWSPTPTPPPASRPPLRSRAVTPLPSATGTPKMKSSGKFASATLNINSAASVDTLRTYQVAVETSAGLDANAVASQIAGVLNDPRSWAGSGNVRFALVADQAQASFTIALASPATAGKFVRAERTHLPGRVGDHD